MIKFRRLMDGYYYCVDAENFTIKKKENIWIGYDSNKMTGNHICCTDNTLKGCKETISNYIENGTWY